MISLYFLFGHTVKDTTIILLSHRPKIRYRITALSPQRCGFRLPLCTLYPLLKAAYPNSKRLLILADGGGSNKARGYLWKEAVQQIGDATGLEISVCHYPSGTSKYNPIERRLWSQVTRTCAAKPLLTLEHAMEYTRHASTRTGLLVQAESSSQIYLSASEKKQMLEKGQIPNGIIDTTELREDISIEHYNEGEKDSALRKWNYTIRPHKPEQAWKNFRKSVLAV